MRNKIHNILRGLSVWYGVPNQTKSHLHVVRCLFQWMHQSIYYLYPSYNKYCDLIGQDQVSHLGLVS